jgi:NADPH:quinone reductase-like Zn-dependent oxidoreductase
LGEWWQQGLIAPVIAAQLPLDRVADAFALVLDRAQTGHVVLTVD